MMARMSLEELLALPERFVDYSGPLGPKFRMSWANTNLCNADPICPYCCTVFDRVRESPGLPRPADEYLQAMLQFGEDWGPYYAISGWGEGLVNDENAKISGAIARRNRIDLTSNFVFPHKRLDYMPRNGNLNFCASFHPHLWNSVDEFIDKALWVISEGFPIAVVGIVGYPPYMKHMERWVGMMRDAGLAANALRFGGMFNGVEYPKAYTAEETEMLLRLNAEPESAQEHLELYLMIGSPRGKMCRAGKDYVLIRWDGEVQRCMSLRWRDDANLGSIFGDVQLMDCASPCTADECPCTDLWQYIED